MKIVIIEDEKLTAKDLVKTISVVEPDVEIVTLLHSVEEAMFFFKTKPEIDLIFSDIELGDGLSFEIFEKLNISTPIIFCTAYNQYALEAFKAVGIDYLLKPFSKQSVGKAIEKFYVLKGKTTTQESDYSSLLSLIKNQLNPNRSPSIIIQQADKIIPLDATRIALFYIEDDGVFAYAFDKTKHLLSYKLDLLEQQFSPTFFRANRQFLVNRKAVKDASHYFNRKIVVNLNIPFQEQILVGKLKVTAFVDWLANN
ncbi:MAG: DNA-binding response regulator [Cytophagaceae bacterium BCCC1]|nr:MAG: DNA-binding response regulator [Cytophagaceae bacterium BCCC1]